MTDSSEARASMRALLRRLWAAILRYRGMVAAMVAFGCLEALFTKLPFVLVKPLIAELGGETGGAPLAQPWHPPLRGQDEGFTERIGNDFNAWFRSFAEGMVEACGLGSSHPGMNVVLACGLVAVLCGLLGAVTIYFVQTVSRMFAIRIVADLRCELARHFLALPLRFFGRQRMGEMISKVTNDTQVMQRSFELAADNVVVDPLMVLGNLVILAWFVPQAIWVLALMVPVLAIPLYRQGRKVSQRSQKTLRAMGEATESLNQILTGIRTVKAFQLEQARLHEFEANTATFLDRTKRMLRTKGLSLAQTFVGYQVGFAALLVVLGYVVLVDRAIGFDDVALVIMPLATTYQHVKRLTRSYHVLMESAGALHGIEQILATPTDPTQRPGRALGRVRGDVELRDVWFAYDQEPVLRGLSLKVQAGQTVALVGASGGGKSTTMDLLLRFHDPQRGQILVDGIDLCEVDLAEYRAHTAVVSQQPFLFNTSIRENIAYGRPGASQAEIEAAARAANIHDFVLSLPQGYDTLAGERGCNLSGGQMQRITIARAILRDPALLFLDEATSALDSENEGLVQQALDSLRAGRTTFVIAHRLSTIAEADLIVVIDRGVVVEVGSHRELLLRGGAYKRMRDLQLA
ncbi:MAG: ABC transporter ATP-binding protein [Planctomycetes bacterium]|nr:ABC transporter ATP-binding protein [Planctomycetota bacterium]